ncbi:MAG TPA: HlyD family efflux transporter periplasmic adaptor subunit [Tepidisphaeraceae bacterium]|nr:HlyD family efflux transporter periplasmic adaptor subunit [Tepidisphaeraceae bacterium]
MSDRSTEHLLLLTILVLASLPAGCERKPKTQRVQGYVEGEYVYVASPLAGSLESLRVDRGAQVKVGDELFQLEHAAEQAVLEEAQHRLGQARANLEDAKKGKRPSEIESLEEQLKQAQSALALSEREFVRQEELSPTGATAVQELDRTRAARNQDLHHVQQLEADLKTARLGARQDQIAAAEADVRAQQAAVARAQWDLSQKQQRAPHAGLVFDVFYRPGEWVAAGKPVVAILPPGNVKVRAFVPEQQVGAIQPGDPARVFIDGVAQASLGKVSFISPQAEYTPPVIYSQESRKKLVFMIEIVFDSETAAKLHPGQPVDVEFSK